MPNALSDELSFFDMFLCIKIKCRTIYLYNKVNSTRNSTDLSFKLIVLTHLRLKIKKYSREL